MKSRAAGTRTFARHTGLPAGAVAAVRTVGDSVWVAMRGVLWLRKRGGSFQPRLRGLGAGWWELRAAVESESEGEVILVVPRGLWRIGPQLRPAVGARRMNPSCSMRAGHDRFGLSRNTHRVLNFPAPN